jgi:hypothetical protein
MKNNDLKESLTTLLHKSQRQNSVSIGEILEILSGRGRLFILILLSIPFCQPLQIPGLSTPFGLIVSFIGFRIAFSKHIWLPKRMLLKTIPSPILQKISQNCLKLMTRIARLIHPRFKWLCNHRTMRVSNGLLIFFLGIFLALPLPIPLTNLAAGWAILLLSIGLLENDGVFISAAYLISIFILVFFILLAFSINGYFREFQ